MDGCTVCGDLLWNGFEDLGLRGKDRLNDRARGPAWTGALFVGSCSGMVPSNSVCVSASVVIPRSVWISTPSVGPFSGTVSRNSVCASASVVISKSVWISASPCFLGRVCLKKEERRKKKEERRKKKEERRKKKEERKKEKRRKKEEGRKKKEERRKKKEERRKKKEERRKKKEERRKNRTLTRMSDDDVSKQRKTCLPHEGRSLARHMFFARTSIRGRGSNWKAHETCKIHGKGR